MTAQTKRAFTRTRHEVPIRYGHENTDRYFDSKMYNSSKGGMYFETDHALNTVGGREPENFLCTLLPWLLPLYVTMEIA